MFKMWFSVYQVVFGIKDYRLSTYKVLRPGDHKS